MKVRAVIVGAGIVGCATALKLAQAFPDWEIVVLEKRSTVFPEASRFNSGVVHSGIHHDPSHLRSKLARRGAALLVRFAEEHGIRIRKSGMLIVVPGSRDLFGLAGEVKSLVRLHTNSRRQGIHLRVLGARGIRRIEPAVRGVLGIYIPEIWVIDQLGVGNALLAEAIRAGAIFRFGSEVKEISRERGHYVLSTRRETWRAGCVVNAGGVASDRVAAMAGFNRYRIFPYRGEYYEVLGEKANLIRSTLVYPALPPRHPVKGIHLTKTADDRLLVGPNAKPWPLREDDFSVRTAPDEFLAAARKFLPDLKEGDLRWAYSGLRAKVNAGAGEDDFVINLDSALPFFVNLVGIESPGFTASLAIAEHVAQMIGGS